MKKSYIAIAGLSLFVTLICWSLSSPINSHRDERYYIGSIWCANGYNERCVPLGLDNYGNRVALFRSDMCIPPGIEETYKRILVDRAVQGCQFEVNGNQPWKEFSVSPNIDYATKEYVATNINTTLSPKYFFQIMHFFVSDNLAESIIAMRIFTAALLCLLLVLLLVLNSHLISQAVVISLLLTLIPQGLFLSSGITVSGWAYIGCAFSWAFLYFLLDRGTKTIAVLFLAAIGWIMSTAIAIVSRYDAIIYIVITNFLVVAIRLANSRIRKTTVTISLLLLVVGIYVLRSNFEVIYAMTSSRPGTITNFYDLLLIAGNAGKLAIATPLRIFGLEGVGWHPMGPPLPVFVATTVLFVFVVYAIHERSNRVQNTFLVLTIGFYLAICISQTYLHPDWSAPFYYVRTGWRGDSFQSRYFLPMVPFVIGMMVLFARNAKSLISEKNFRMVFISISFFTHFVSLQGVGIIFRENTLWYWREFPLGVDSLLVIGSLSFFVFLISATQVFSNEPPRTSPNEIAMTTSD